VMSNPKRDPSQFVPNHKGTQPRNVHANKGKKMEMNTPVKPKVIQTKGKK